MMLFPEESMWSFVPGASEVCPLNHSTAGSGPAFHLAITLICWSEPSTAIKHLLRRWDVESTNATTCIFFASGPDSMVLFHVAAPIIALHTQIALWESDDFVSGRDNAEYDNQRSLARPYALLQSSLDWYKSGTWEDESPRAPLSQTLHVSSQQLHWVWPLSAVANCHCSINIRSS